ncbi:hypothetical protein L9F63_004903 [Diploptera punctata]|uniref:L-Fucosyltransferase n=1 Tax=Diploptera punctata TaxID=6984 RepID=A0AAD7ZE37_DIPPU|nr:hypothetical protein L9F63_004903 [Diploptera punctata]
MQSGRLGNQIWQYVSVVVIANITGRAAFVPSCILQEMSSVFKNLTALPLKYIGNFDGDIVLPVIGQLPYHIIPHLKEVRHILEFHDYLTEKSQEILRNSSKGQMGVVFVSVHVRRTDYEFYLRIVYNRPLVTADYFRRQMDYFRNKYTRVILMIVSDDPDWSERELSADDTAVVRDSSPEQDLSLMASCNHSILDYGTFGTWGALLAGGETVLYDIKYGLEQYLVDLMPNWHFRT